VPAKATAAIAIPLEQPEQDLAAAAKAAGLTTRRLTQYLSRPHVRKYFVDERQVLLDSICAGNPVALKTIRDTSGNAMARAQEAIEDAMNNQAGGQAAPPAPGVVIVIEAGNGQPERIIGPPTPVIEHVQEADISDEV
jgi:hypothetical protein